MSCKDTLEFYFTLNLLHQEVARCLKRQASYLGLSSVELQALWIAGSESTTTIADLARVTGYTKEQLEKVVSALKRDNLVEEVRTGDSLCTFIRATVEGKHLLSQVFTRPSRCTCPIKKDDPRFLQLGEVCRSLVMDFRGKGACQLIENACRHG
ncbi:MAG: MarR family transcriptional regulator [Firmicutes bacterium]|nr:MarR family transcriptional regulator [Bacillota bacterium]